MFKICIDAGHYGKYNRAPSVSAYYESDMSWKLHLLQKKFFEEYEGVTVITTRESQKVDLAVYKRGTASKGCNLFISNHSNAVGSSTNESVDYPVVCVPLNGRGDALGQKLANVIQKTMGTRQSGRIMKRKGSSGGEYYGVIRGAVAVGTVGMILEHSFHSNTKAAKWLLSSANLEKLAKAEVEVIAAHYGLKKKATTVKQAEAKSKADAKSESKADAKSEVTSSRFKVCTKEPMNVRSGPGVSYDIKCVAPASVYTIVDTSGSWGKLLSGAGWINISSKYATRV